MAVGAAAFPAAALAAPVTVNLRVEGASQTLFEGPVTTYGHAVQAASDSTSRQCDGTNNGANASPGGTATTALVDGLSTVDTTWDGTWAPTISDYTVSRVGPDSQTSTQFWGQLESYQFSPVSGCQPEVNPNDQVLWAYDAFNAVRFLRLSASATSVAPGDRVNAPAFGSPVPEFAPWSPFAPPQPRPALGRRRGIPPDASNPVLAQQCGHVYTRADQIPGRFGRLRAGLTGRKT